MFDTDLSPVNCEHPSFVLNRDWYDLFYKYKKLYYLREGVECCMCYENYSDWSIDRMRSYVYSVVYPYLTPFSMNEFGFRPLNSPRVPLFYLFPCGRCRLCRSRKSSEYSFRAACESAVYPINQLFVTLTYAPWSLPSDGVRLDHLQNFFKRLRWKLGSLGLPTDFRYMAVSEYGAKYGRPHYHIIFWNLPVLSDPLKLHSYIRFAWMSYMLDSDGNRQYVYSKFHRKRFPKRRSFGIVKILPVQSGCTAYITKYFRKENFNRSNFVNKTFLVSSRRNGGIGASYIKSMYNYVTTDVNVNSLSVRDLTANRVFKYPISGYIKNTLFPSLSVLYRKEKLYDSLRDIANGIEKMRALAAFYFSATGNPFKCIRWDKIKSFLPYLRFFYKHRSDSYLMREYSYYRTLTSDECVSEMMKTFENIVYIM